MELLRIHQIKVSSLLVFLGFLLSNSTTIYQGTDLKLLSNLDELFWQLLIYLILIVNVFGTIKFLFTSSCCFALEVSQYILVPLSTFILTQRVEYIRPKSESYSQIVSVFLSFSLIMVLTIFKIIYMNQTFPGEGHKEMLQFQIGCRIYRIVKICINTMGYLVFQKQNFLIFSIVLNLIDLVMIYKKTTFIDIQLEIVLQLASLNTIVSILQQILIKSKIPICQWLMSQFIVSAVFLIKHDFLRPYIEFKLMNFFNGVQINRNNFHKEETKKTIMLLLQCFHKIYSFKDEIKIQVKKEEKNKWSNNFLKSIKRAYEIILYFYLCQIDANLSNQNNIILNFSLKSQKKITRYYQQKTNQSLKFREILQSKRLFLNFVAFCMDNLQNKDMKNLPWSYSNQFFLIFACHLNSKFVIKKMFYYTNRLTLKDESIMYKARNSKVGRYLQYYKSLYNNNNSLNKREQQFMKFQHSLKSLKLKFYKICKQEIQLVQKLASPKEKIFQYQRNLALRQKNKQKILKLFNLCFSRPEYIYFQDFTYLYMMFMVIYCKSIHKTAQKIRQRFIVPRRNKQNNIKIDCHYLLNKAILVCCGQQNTQVSLGQIIMTNVTFRKRFSFSTKQYCKNKIRTISDLIIGNEQKSRHIHLMVQSCKNSQFLIQKNSHTSYCCFLKANLNTQTINILRQYRVNTRIFQNFSENILYLCDLEQISSDFYVTISDLKRFRVKKSYNQNTKNNQIKLQDSRLLAHEQLGKVLNLYKLSADEYEQIGVVDQVNDTFSIDSMQVKVDYNDLDRNFQYINNIQCYNNSQKFAKIQDGIWKKTSRNQNRVFKYVSLMMGLGMCTFVLCLFIIHKTKQSRQNSYEVVTQFKNFIVVNLNIPLEYSIQLFLLKNINISKISSSICQAYSKNLTKEIFEDLSQGKAAMKEYYSKYYQNKLKIIPIYDPSFIELNKQYYAYDFTNVIYNISSLAEQYMNTDFSKIINIPQQIRQFNQYIKMHSNVNKLSFVKNVLQSAQKISGAILSHYLNVNNMIYISCCVIIIVSTFVFCIFFVKYYMEFVKYFQILWNIDQNYFHQRVKQMKFINKQIHNMDNFYVKKFQFLSNFQFIMKSQEISKKNIQCMDLDQFQKIAQQCEQRFPLQVGKKQQKNLYTEILLSKKFTLSIMFISLIFLLFLMAKLGQITSNIISNHRKCIKTIVKGQQAILGLNSMNFHTWSLVLQQNNIYSINQSKDIITQNYMKLEQQQFFYSILKQFNQKVLQETVYSDIESTQIKYDQKYTRKRLKQDNWVSTSLLNLPIFQVVGIVSKNLHQVSLKIERNQFNTIQQICYNAKLLRQYLKPGIIAIFDIVLQNMNGSFIQTIHTYYLLIYFILLFGFMFLIQQLFRSYYSLTQVIKFQILTIDTPEDLYKNPHFRPYLNKIVYQYFK